MTETPVWIPRSKFKHNVARRGETYYYHYQQLLARYKLERLSHDLGEIEEIDWNHNIVTGYLPTMVDYTGEAFPRRPPNSPIPIEKYKYVQVNFI